MADQITAPNGSAEQARAIAAQAVVGNLAPGAIPGTGINWINVLTSPFRPRRVDFTPIDTDLDDNNETEDYTPYLLAGLLVLIFGGIAVYLLTQKSPK